MRYLVLGSGPAGIAAALAVRNAERNAEIVIATEEYSAPYLRPHRRRFAWAVAAFRVSTVNFPMKSIWGPVKVTVNLGSSAIRSPLVLDDAKHGVVHASGGCPR